MYSPRLAWVCILEHFSVTVHSAAVNICQSEVNKLKNVCYWVENTIDTFSGSQQRCAAKGGNLATSDSAETNQFLKEFLNDVGITDHCWIGYDERNLTWMDGTPFSWESYNPGEPSSGYEDCTLYVVNSWNVEQAWIDTSCSLHSSGLCQIQVPPGPYFAGVNAGSTVSVGDRVVVVETVSRVACAVRCERHVSCSVCRYLQADRSCTLYTSGTVLLTADNTGEWFVQQ